MPIPSLECHLIEPVSPMLWLCSTRLQQTTILSNGPMDSIKNGQQNSRIPVQSIKISAKCCFTVSLFLSTTKCLSLTKEISYQWIDHGDYNIELHCGIYPCKYHFTPRVDRKMDHIVTAENVWGHLPMNRPKHHVLVSWQVNIISKCHQNNKLPGSLFKTSVTCKFCSNVFSTGRCRVSLIPKKTPRKKIRKIILKNENNPELLRPFEKSLLEKCTKDKDNKLVIKCLMCKKNTSVPLSKPEKQILVNCESDNKETPILQKKKKKRKKDIFAGLNSSVVSLCTPKQRRKQSDKTPASVNSNQGNIHMSSSSSIQANQTQNEKSKKSKQKVKFGGNTPKSIVNMQVKNAKIAIESAKKSEKLKKKMAVQLSAKKAKKCNALKKVLDTTPVSSPKPSLKDFFKSLK
ncbi:hypothetical protein C0J52_12852 [Blattella germanica]|nr:hypothetical protein C0J52_12852 [Blattella germanica]